MKNILFVLLAMLLFSCEKNINFKLDDTAPSLVVEGEIENGKAPRVVLTKSTSYYSVLTPELYTNSFVHDADVYVSNGTLTHKLKEYTQPLFPGFNQYYYGIDSNFLSTAFLGELNTNYQLRILTEGKEYLAQSKIPALSVQPDSFYFKPAPQNPDTNKRVMFIRAQDPQGLGNYLRYFTQKNSEPFYPGFNSVFTDEIIDGTQYTVQLQPGVNRNEPFKPDSNFFKKADTVTLKFCNIDRSTYTFWNTWEFSLQTVGNPFSQPNKVISNVSNGALGAFCGYGATYRTLIVQ